MKMIVDGHNLIPKIPGMSLKQIDDEYRLVEILQEYARVARRKIEVFFDNAPAGKSGTRMAGTVRVNYVPSITTADEAIILRVRKAGKLSGELTVVSSDQHVQTQCRLQGAKTMSSESFTKNMLLGFEKDQTSNQSQPEHTMSSEELEDWMNFFGITE